MIPPRILTGREALAWQNSAAFRKAVKGQLVCQALDSDEDEPVIAIYALGNCVWSRAIGDDDHQEYFDAIEADLAAEEREILAKI